MLLLKWFIGGEWNRSFPTENTQISLTDADFSFIPFLNHFVLSFNNFGCRSLNVGCRSYSWFWNFCTVPNWLFHIHRVCRRFLSKIPQQNRRNSDVEPCVSWVDRMAAIFDELYMGVQLVLFDFRFCSFVELRQNDKV